MNSSERVFAVVQGMPVDRPAFAAVLSLYGARLIETATVKYYSDAQLYAEGQKAVYETFSPDILFSPFAFAAVAEAFGSSVHFFKDHPPVLKSPALKSIRELDRFQWPDPNSHPRLTFLTESIRLMKQKIGDAVPIAGVAMSPADLPSMILGMDGWLETVLCDPEGAARMLAMTESFFVQIANGLLAAGAAFIATPCVYLSPILLPRRIVMDLTLPSTRKALARINGPVVLHHAGGKFLSHADLVPNLPQVIGLVLDHEDNLEKGRQAVGPKMTLLGGISGPDLGASTAAAIRDQARGILWDRRNDPRFILCTTGPDVPIETPLDNILAMRQAVLEHGNEHSPA